METKTTLICATLICLMNILLGIYAGRRGILGFFRFDFNSFLMGGLVIVTSMIIQYAQTQYGFIAQRKHILISLAFLVFGIVIGRISRGGEFLPESDNEGLASNRLMSWEELKPALARFTEKKIYIGYQLEVDGPYKIAQLVSESLQTIDLNSTYSGKYDNSWMRTKDLSDSDIVAWIYGQGVNSVGQPTFLVCEVLHPKSGMNVNTKIYDPRKATLQTMSAIYMLLERAEKADSVTVQVPQDGTFDKIKSLSL